MSRQDEIEREIRRADETGDSISYLAGHLVAAEEHRRKQGEFMSEVRSLMNKASAESVSKKLQALGEFEDSIKRLLNDVRSVDKATQEKTDLFVDHANRGLQEMLQGLNFAESRVNGMWNTMNTVIEFLAWHFENPDGIAVGHGGAERFKAKLMELGAALLQAALKHRQSEMARIRLEQKFGQKPTPMRPLPPSFAHQVISMIQDTVNTAISDEVKADEEAGNGVRK